MEGNKKIKNLKNSRNGYNEIQRFYRSAPAFLFPACEFNSKNEVCYFS